MLSWHCLPAFRQDMLVRRWLAERWGFDMCAGSSPGHRRDHHSEEAANGSRPGWSAEPHHKRGRPAEGARPSQHSQVRQIIRARYRCRSEAGIELTSVWRYAMHQFAFSSAKCRACTLTLELRIMSLEACSVRPFRALANYAHDKTIEILRGRLSPVTGHPGKE